MILTGPVAWMTRFEHAMAVARSSVLYVANEGKFLVDKFQEESFDFLVFRRATASTEIAAGDELTGAYGVNAACLEVENFLVSDLGGGGAVGAFHLVRVDFKAGHGVCLAVIGHEKVSAGLVGVGMMGIFIDGDEAGEDGFRVAVEGVFVKKIRVCAFGNVMLEGALVVFLFVIWDADGKHVGVGAGPSRRDMDSFRAHAAPVLRMKALERASRAVEVSLIAMMRETSLRA